MDHTGNKRSMTNRHGDKSGAWSDQQADALHIANQLTFARLMIGRAQEDYDAGSMSAGDGLRDEAERALAQAVDITNELGNADPGVQGDITAVQELLTKLRPPASRWKPVR